MLRMGNGSGTTSWSIATNQINKLSYGHPSGQKDTLVGIRYGFGGQVDASVNKILHLSNNGNTPLVYTTIGRLGLGTETPTHRLDISYADISAMRVGNTLNVDTSNNRVGIGTTDPITTSAILELSSTSKGFLPPRMTTAQKNALSTPAEGLMIYDTDLKRPCFYNGTTWVTL